MVLSCGFVGKIYGLRLILQITGWVISLSKQAPRICSSYRSLEVTYCDSRALNDTQYFAKCIEQHAMKSAASAIATYYEVFSIHSYAVCRYNLCTDTK